MAAPFLALGEPVKIPRTYKDRQNQSHLPIKTETKDEELFLRLLVASLDQDQQVKIRHN